MSYRLADGSYSSEYKVGDKFVVVDRGDHSGITNGQIVTLSDNDDSCCPFFNDNTACIWWCKLRAVEKSAPSAKEKLEELLADREEDVVLFLTQQLKEYDKQQNIRKELEFAKAKRERLDKHIAVLEGKLEQ